MSLYLFWAYVIPKRAVDLMVSMISCLSASIKADGDVYVSSKVSDVLVVTFEKYQDTVEMPYAVHLAVCSHTHCGYPLDRSIHDRDYGSLKQGRMA